MAYLGKREPEIYGTTTAAELDALLQHRAHERQVELEIFYTHIEGEAIGRIYRAAEDGVDGLLMNPAGFMHTGYALRDCVRAMHFPCVEVHMSNIEKRELKSVTACAARGTIAGFGVRSYLMGLDVLARADRGRGGQHDARRHDCAPLIARERTARSAR